MAPGQADAARQLLHDPVTGHYLGINRHHTFLEVLVSDIDFTFPDAPVGPGVTVYGIGAAGRPMPAPILRQHYPVDPELLPDRTLRQAEELLEFNDQTGAMDASPEELLLLHEQLERALRER
ncbi:MAG: hypothetical protein QOF58_1948 [Pseudonocardiales bacterium]|jgi:hypothetical protein|nr:hypothetical protein [Pseudonocardiales bacterium]